MPLLEPSCWDSYDSMDDFMVGSSDEEDRRRPAKKTAAAAGKGKKKGKGKKRAVSSDSDSDDSGSDDDDAAPKKKNAAASDGEDKEDEAAAVEWHAAERPQADVEEIEASGKARVFFQLLDAAAKQGERTLLFSQSLFLLDLLEAQLADRPRPHGDGYRWKRGRDWLRLDGSTKVAQRMRMVDHFQEASSDVRLFLISTRAGNLGINLTAATRVVLFDSSMNPSNDAQVRDARSLTHFLDTLP